MSQRRISKGQAIDLQEWALEESGTKEFLKNPPELPKKGMVKHGLYVSYEIDETELDGGIDWPDVGVATVIGVLRNGRKEIIGEVRAYNWEAIWLGTADFDEIDDPQEWWKCIKDAYRRLEKSDKKGKEINFAGTWRIYEMETWGKDYFNMEVQAGRACWRCQRRLRKDYFNMEVQAYIKIGADNSGDFQFGLVRGEIDGKVVNYADEKRFEFTWEGNDECDPACGSGWVKPKENGLLEGEFRIHSGESSTFSARKAKNHKTSGGKG